MANFSFTTCQGSWSRANALFSAMEVQPLTTMSMQKFSTQNRQIVRSKKKLCFQVFRNAPTKSEGAGVSFDDANEAYTARYTHETVLLAFALTEEAIEDNLYDRLGARYTKLLPVLWRILSKLRLAAVLNNAFDSAGSQVAMV